MTSHFPEGNGQPLSFTPRLKRSPVENKTVTEVFIHDYTRCFSESCINETRTPDKHPFAAFFEKSPAAEAQTPPVSPQAQNHADAKTTPVPAAWKDLPEKELWQYYVKIRELRLQKKPPSHAPLEIRYQAITDFLFRKYLPDILKVVATYFYRNMPQHSLLDRADLEQAASIAMFNLLSEFDPSVGTTFMQYANAKKKSRIRGAVIDCLRSLQEYPREWALKRRIHNPRFEALRAKLGHKPTYEEYCDEYGWEHAETIWNQLFWSGVYNQSQFTSRRAGSHGGSDTEEMELESLANYEAKPIRLDAKLTRLDNIDSIMELLPDDEMKYIVWAYYWKQDTNERIAKSLTASGRTICVSSVGNKRKEAEAILKSKLTQQEYENLVDRFRE